MKYLVIELQGTGEAVANIVSVYDTQAEAESKYYLVLSAAAVSSVPVHTAIIMSSEGFVYDRKCYKHEEVAS